MRRATLLEGRWLSAVMRLQVLRNALVLALLVLAHAAGAGSTNLVPIEIHETLQGHFVYVKNCLPCHGKRGDGKGEMGLTVQPPPRDFGAGLFKYRSTPSGSLPTNEDLARTVRHGIPDTAMPAFTTLLPRDLDAVIEYVKTFSPRWREPGNYASAMAIPQRPDWFADTEEFSRRASKGRSLFATACAACHGTNGDGAGSVTNLMDSWGHPIRARDLRLSYVRSGSRLEDIYRVLVTGLDGTPMPSFAEGTTPEQRWELIAFIEQLRREYRARD